MTRTILKLAAGAALGAALALPAMAQSTGANSGGAGAAGAAVGSGHEVAGGMRALGISGAEGIGGLATGSAPEPGSTGTEANPTLNQGNNVYGAGTDMNGGEVSTSRGGYARHFGANPGTWSNTPGNPHP